MLLQGLIIFLLRLVQGDLTNCGCPNMVPYDKVSETLERSLWSSVAGHGRIRSKLVAYVKRQMYARLSGTSRPLRLHFTGPSGVGKSFLARLLATAQFEESATYTGYRAAGAAAATTSVTALAVVGVQAATSWTLTAALVAAPVAAGGAALAAVAGWRLVEYGETYWSVDPAPYPTQCGVSWWKFQVGAGKEDVERSLRSAAKTAAKCSTAVLIFEDVNRIDQTGLTILERLTDPILRAHRVDSMDTNKKKTIAASLRAATVVFTSDLHRSHGADQAAAPVLDDGMTLDEADAVVELQSRTMWPNAVPPTWWSRDVATLAMPPLSDDDLAKAVELYLHNDVTRDIRDVLRSRLSETRRRHESSFFSYFVSGGDDVVTDWTGTVAFDEAVVDQIRDFVRRGLDDWRCHAITHFHTTFVEPQIDTGVDLLLNSSHDLSQDRRYPSSGVLTSSLLMTLTPRSVNVGSTLEKVVYDLRWNLVHLDAVPPD